jgi:hypothetical protein
MLSSQLQMQYPASIQRPIQAQRTSPYGPIVLWVSLLAHAESGASSLMTEVLLLAYNVGKRSVRQAKPTFFKKTEAHTHISTITPSYEDTCIHYPINTFEIKKN